MIRFDDDARVIELGVGDLLEASSPHLGRGAAMSTVARLRLGRTLHEREQGAYVEGWRAEVVVRHSVVIRGWTCRISGRVDGLGEEQGRRVVEELKSSALDAVALAAIPGFPAWEEQLRCYLWLVASSLGGEVVGRLRVVSLVDGSSKILAVEADPLLGDRVAARLGRVVLTRERRLHRLALRRTSPVRFPFSAFRAGQDEMVNEVEGTVLEGGALLLEAPTGAGKTAAALHGVLRAAALTGRRVLWATARGPQQAVAEAALRAVVAAGTPIRSVTLRARDKVCLRTALGEGESPDCRPEVCRFARNYHTKLLDSDLVERAASEGVLLPERLSALSLSAEVCPAALARDCTEAVDVVIGDLNYFFDPDGHLLSLGGPDDVVVIDEAHQLVERARQWGSPAVTRSVVDAVLAAYRAPEQHLLRRLADDVVAELDELPLRVVSEWAGPEQLVEVPPRRWEDLRDRFDELALDHLRVRAPDPDPWPELARAVDRFARVLRESGPETVLIGSDAGIRLFCRDPSAILGPQLAEPGAVIAMSATLRPMEVWADQVGLPGARTLRKRSFLSTFPPENRLVLVVSGLSTAWKHRERDRDRVAQALSAGIGAVPGNCAVFFSSFEQRADLVLRVDLGGREALRQEPGMSEAERSLILDTMRAPGPPKVLLAVMGGIFGEGVDLAGDALRAVFVVGPGLPPPSLERRLQEEWEEEQHGEGYRRAWLHPGLTRVVQAAGRVVRRPEDRGAVVLICQRFLQREIQEFFPEDWAPVRARDPAAALRRFFEGEGGGG